MPIRFAQLSILFATCAGVCLAQGYSSVSLAKAPHGIPPKSASMVRPAGQPNSTNNGILYHGGPMLNKPSGTNLYLIFCGDWSNQSSKQILTDFANHIGGTPYYNINTTYYDYDKEGEIDSVFNKVNFVTSVEDNYSVGNSLSDFGVAQLVANHTGVDLPIDENGVYFVLPSADVTVGEFCSVYCAWHSNATVIYSNLPGHTFDIKVAFVGNPNQCFNACGVQDPSPNNNPGADSMVFRRPRVGRGSHGPRRQCLVRHERERKR